MTELVFVVFLETVTMVTPDLIDFFHNITSFFREECFKYVLRIGISYQGLSYQKYFEYATKIVMIEAVIVGFFETENVSS